MQSLMDPSTIVLSGGACIGTVLCGGRYGGKSGRCIIDEDEAGFIAMHIINARLHTNMGQIPDLTKLVNACAEIADTFYRGKLDKTTVAYERFLVHLKYLAKRLFHSQELPNVLSRDEEILDFVRRKFQKHYRCAKCMQDYILKNFSKTISEDEMLTLTIHLKKIGEFR